MDFEKVRKPFAGLALAASLAFAFSGPASAAACSSGAGSTADVTFGTTEAVSCGAGSGQQDFIDLPISSWTVNTDSAGGSSSWVYVETSESDQVDNNGLNQGDTLDNTTLIGLSTSEILENGTTSGSIWITNATSPFLVTLKDGASYNYQWYLFEGLTGEQHGTFNALTLFGGSDISHVRVYEQTVVPVPAAVWLFGSGLLGLVGAARRRRS